MKLWHILTVGLGVIVALLLIVTKKAKAAVATATTTAATNVHQTASDTVVGNVITAITPAEVTSIFDSNSPVPVPGYEWMRYDDFISNPLGGKRYTSEQECHLYQNSCVRVPKV